MNFDNRIFVDSGVEEPLPPLFKGGKQKFFPGQMVRHSSKGIRDGSTGQDKFRREGLRRYVFRYENGKFIYLATRKGQRNGGFNSKPTQTNVQLYLSDLQNNGLAGGTFTALSGSDLTLQYKESENSILKYNINLTRWEWSTRPSLTASFVPQAFSGPTSNIFRNSGAVNEVPWTYVQNAWTTGTPEIPAIAVIIPSEWYNNNSVANLNKWPIKNIDADYGVDPSFLKPWQKKSNLGTVVDPDRRIDGLTDDFLNRCFAGVNLKNYSVVFVEVFWRFRLNKADIKNTTVVQPTYKNSSWGYWDQIHDQEWWSPKPFLGHTQKGRVYRIGILEADTGVGGFDKVLWAQRTRIITTRRTRGGRTALD
jgi:hypothetical protein